MNSSTYRGLLKVLELWPVDANKTGRDLGEFLRKQIAHNFSSTKASQVKNAVWDDISVRLTRLTSDHYKNTFSVSKCASASGLTEFECNQVLSNEFLKYLEEEDEATAGSSVKTFISRLPFGKSVN